MILQVIEDNLEFAQNLYTSHNNKYVVGYGHRVIDEYGDLKSHIYLMSLEWWEKNKNKGLSKKEVDKIIKKIIWNQFRSNKSEWFRHFRKKFIREKRLLSNRDVPSIISSEHTPFDMDDVKKFLLEYYSGYSYVDRTWKLIIFTMRHIEGLKIKDISSELGIGKVAVMKQLRSVEEVLKNRFNHANYN